ncbi:MULTISPECIES: hypothetical protein [unclassified Streptomyces]|uniref:hypothetical protein n=1 Tax=unclassified Streptomyces TaxID=2593676 RepID=UPI0033B35C28
MNSILSQGIEPPTDPERFTTGIGEDRYKKRNTVERSINRQDADRSAAPGTAG